jgi:hypothetical protein
LRTDRGKYEHGPVWCLPVGVIFICGSFGQASRSGEKLMHKVPFMFAEIALP